MEDRKDRPSFLDYKHVDHASARQIKYVGDFVDWVKWEIERAVEAVVALTSQRRHEEAYYASAKAEALTEILLLVSAPDEPAGAVEEKFFDPAMPEGEEVTDVGA